MNLEKNLVKKTVFEIKLFWEVYKKSGFFYQVSYIIASFFAVMVYIFAPDLIPGLVDDFLLAPWVIPILVAKVWIALKPDWFVDEQKELLKKKLETKPGPKKAPTQKPPQPAPKKQPAENILVVTRSTNWSTLHLMPSLSDKVKSNRKLKNELKKICEFVKNGENLVLRVANEKESLVVDLLSKNVPGLKIQYP